MPQPPHLFFTTSQIRNPQPSTLVSYHLTNSTLPRICNRPPERMATVPTENVGSPRTPSPPAPHSGYPPAGQILGYSTPSSVASAPLSSEPTAPHDMHYYLTAGLEGVEPQKYRNARSFIRAIRSQSKKFYSSCSSNASQYAVFAPVTQDQLAAIDRIRQTSFKGHRLLYFDREETLIVKVMAGEVQAVASKGFGVWLDGKIAGMGLVWDIARTESATYKGNGSQYEADCAWKPWNSRRLRTDFPTLIIECGVSQSRDRLAVDAHWWLENSGGQVKIVLLISFSESKKEIHVEQWELVTIPDPHVTHSQPRPTRTAPTIIREFDLVQGVPNEASLTLNFEKVFLRPPAKGEGDFTFSQEDLESYSTHVWNCAG